MAMRKKDAEALLDNDRNWERCEGGLHIKVDRLKEHPGVLRFVEFTKKFDSEATNINTGITYKPAYAVTFYGIIDRDLGTHETASRGEIIRRLQKGEL